MHTTIPPVDSGCQSAANAAYDARGGHSADHAATRPGGTVGEPSQSYLVASKRAALQQRRAALRASTEAMREELGRLAELDVNALGALPEETLHAYLLNATAALGVDLSRKKPPASSEHAAKRAPAGHGGQPRARPRRAGAAQRDATQPMRARQPPTRDSSSRAASERMSRVVSLGDADAMNADGAAWQPDASAIRSSEDSEAAAAISDGAPTGHDELRR